MVHITTTLACLSQVIRVQRSLHEGPRCAITWQQLITHQHFTVMMQATVELTYNLTLKSTLQHRHHTKSYSPYWSSPCDQLVKRNVTGSLRYQHSERVHVHQAI